MHVTRLGRALPCVVKDAAGIVEGLAVQLTNSGEVNGFYNDLPIARPATATATRAVYILEAAPDEFSRPVDSRQYKAGWYTTLNWNDASFSEPLRTPTLYEIGISNLDNPTVPSGFVARAHKGCTVTVKSTCYVDSAGIKVPGALVKVGANAKWEVTTTESEAVGEIREYNSTTQDITFDLYDN